MVDDRAMMDARIASLIWWVVALVVGCGASGAVGDPRLRAYLPSGPPTVPGSYVSPFANGTQNGRVPVVYRQPTTLTRVAGLPTRRDRRGAPIEPATLLIPEGSPFVAVDYGPGEAFEIRQQSGERLELTNSSWTTMPRGRVSLATREGILVGPELIHFAGLQSLLSRVPSSKPLATFYHAGHLVTVDLSAPLLRPPAGGAPVPWAVHASMRRREPTGWQDLWYFTLGGPDGVACAAIDERGQVGIATRQGRFLVLGPEGTVDGRPSGKSQRQLASSPYLMSSIAGTWVLLEPRRAPTASERLTGLETFEDLVEQARAADEERSLTYALYVDPARSQIAWRTGVVTLDGGGEELSTVEVPFRVLSPPIDAGGVVVVVGEGIAALHGGQVLWMEATQERVRATAFADGTLAATFGRELRLLRRDGTLLHVLRTPEEEPITTTPAIAGDGSVWVASARGLYVAR